MDSREVMLGRVRAALRSDAVAADEEIDRRYRQHIEESRGATVALFAERVADYRAIVRRIEASDLAARIAESLRARGVESLAVPPDIPAGWLPHGLTILRDSVGSPLSNEQLDRCGGVLTGCAVAIAQTGTIILDGGARQGRRALSLLPDYHLCMVAEEQIVGIVPEAIARLADIVHQAARPITFISGPSATSDIELNRVEGVHGPRTLEVLIVSGEDERWGNPGALLQPPG